MFKAKNSVVTTNPSDDLASKPAIFQRDKGDW